MSSNGLAALAAILMSLCFHDVTFAGQPPDEKVQLERGAVAYDNGDYDAALSIWLPIANSGNAFAAFNIGMLYYNGRGVSRDPAKAAEWFHKAAEAGFYKAQTMLGSMFVRGVGVECDYVKAKAWLEKAALQGDHVAQRWLGDMYIMGHGVKTDYQAAVKWYRLAAKDNDWDTRNTLAYLLATAPDAEVRNGSEALRIALSVVAELEVASTLDTLASAYAEVGNYEKAVTIQTKAIKLLKAEDRAAKADDFERRLEHYKSKRPWRLQ